MSRKYHVKKARSASNYKQRLADRGLGKAPAMPDVKTLRRRQLNKEEANILEDREMAALIKGGRR